ncbi:MAG: manganese catalase family protein [Bacilli bacterium]
MWMYSKKLQYPINIKNRDLRMVKYIISQYGGPQGELGAAIRYLNQRYTMPDDKGKALLTDIGTEELAHVEMICTMLYQLLQGATKEELESAGLGSYYTEHGFSVFPSDSSGTPWDAKYISTTGNPIADLEEDLAAEQKAKTIYEHLMNLTMDPDILGPLAFLRQREIVHYQRFKELSDEYKIKGYK